MVQTPKRLPLSGAEPKFTQRLWGRAIGINNNNCYAYAFGDYEKSRSYKSVPGNRAGIMNMNNSYINCKKLQHYVISDNPNKVYVSKAESKCKPGHYKVMMFIAPGKGYFRQGDFHFYKQVNEIEYKVKAGNTYESIARFFKVPVERVKRAGKLIPGKLLRFKANLFAHKRGWATGPLITDAKNKVITDPRKASRNYPGLNYTTYCTSFCVKNKGIKVGHTHPKVRQKTG